MLDAAVHGGREHQHLTRRRRSADDGFDVIREAHVQHAVGFVKDEHVECRQVDAARVDVVEQAARRGDDDVRHAGQHVELLRVGHPAQDARADDTAQMAAVLCGGGGHLQGQFTRGREHQQRRLGRCRAWAAAFHALRRAVHARTLRLRLFADALDGRQDESGGLARTSLARDQQVAAGQAGRNGLRLHRRGRGVVHFAKRADDAVVQAQCSKGACTGRGFGDEVFGIGVDGFSVRNGAAAVLRLRHVE